VVAAFQASNTSICQGDNVNFTDASQNATSWAWSFQGGTPATSNQQNPSIQYLNTGTFDVSLTATGNSGFDTDVQPGLITVNPTPSVLIGLNLSMVPEWCRNTECKLRFVHSNAEWFIYGCGYQ
jgi:PKD repeat protein